MNNKTISIFISILLSLSISFNVYPQANNDITQKIKDALENSIKNIAELKDGKGLDLTINGENNIYSYKHVWEREKKIISFGLSKEVEDGDTEIFVNKDGVTTDTKLSLSITNLMIPKSHDIEWLDNLAKEVQIAKTALDECKKSENSKILKEINCKEQQKTFDELSKSNIVSNDYNELKKIGFFSLDISYTKGDFKFFSLPDNNFNIENNKGYEASIIYGKINTKNPNRHEWGLTYVDGNSPDSNNDQKNICRPLTQNNSFNECFDTYLSPTTKTKKIIPYFRYAKMIQGQGMLKGFEAKLSYEIIDKEANNSNYDEKSERFKLSVPIYLYTKSNDNLNAGFELRWQERLNPTDDSFSFSIFFNTGDLFDIFKK